MPEKFETQGAVHRSGQKGPPEVHLRGPFLLPDEIGAASALCLGRRKACLPARLDTPEHPSKIPAQVPHGLEPLGIQRHIAGDGAVDHGTAPLGHPAKKVSICKGLQDRLLDGTSTGRVYLGHFYWTSIQK